MSQRAVLRGFFVCLLTLLAARPAAAAITFSPDPVVVGVGGTSDLITAQVVFEPGPAAPPGGVQTLEFDDLVYYGLSTEPSTVSFVTAPGQMSATVTFRLVAQPTAYPSFFEVPVTNSPTPAGSGLLNVEIRPLSISPAFVIVPAGTTSESLTATIVFGGEIFPSGPQQLVFSGLPAGATTVPSPVSYSVPPQQYGAQVPFQIAVGPAVPSGTYAITVSNSPVPAGEASFFLTVLNPGSLTATVERPSLSLCAGGAAVTNSVTVSPVDDYQGGAVVTFPALPGDILVSPSTLPVGTMPPARTVSFSVSARAGATPGPKTVNVLVTGVSGVTASAVFTADVQAGDFAPAVAPAALTLNGGGAAGTLTASLAPGGCLPTANVVVTPSGLPPGVTATPASATLVAPSFAPVAFSLQASSSAAPGPSTITFTFVPTSGAAKTVTATVTVCGPPAAPVSPVVRPQGNPQGPVTATDFLALSWGVPASGFTPTKYEWRINGGAWNAVTATAGTAPPRGAIDPVQLFVRGYACNPERGPGPEASSPVYPLAAPVANFSIPASVVAGQAVTFTDTTSPQATSWLWFPGDGVSATTVQSPTVTFPAAGPKVIVLVASNGSGTSSKATTVNVLPASSVSAAASVSVRSLDRQRDGRLALDRVEVEEGTTLVLRRLEGEGDAVAYLRLLDGEGRVAVERRLVLAEGEEARHDLSAWGATGAFRVELVGPEGLEAVVEDRAIPFGGPEEPVRPGRPRGAGIR